MVDTNSNSGFFSKDNDLRNRILFTIFILSIYRLGTYIPLPGIDPESLKTLMESQQRGLMGMLNIFSGGAVKRMAIFALGIMPYISSSIIMQLLTGVSETFKNLKNQGEIGRKKITQYTRYGTVLLATIQGYGVSVGLENSDIICLSVTQQKKPIINTKEIALMKPNAGIVNISNGNAIDEEALIEALEDAKIKFAGLDTYDNEPTPAIKLLMNERISLTPHIGGLTGAATDRSGEVIAKEIIARFHGKSGMDFFK